MRISFDLDGVLLLSRYDDPAKMEPPPSFPWNRFYEKDRVRKGAPELIHTLHQRGFEVWIYTSSGRTEWYLKHLFQHYGMHFDDIVNMQRHEREIQKGRPNRYPTKMPCRYQISLHVDDEKIVERYGREYGFNVLVLNKESENWVQDVLNRAEEIRARENRNHGIQSDGTEKIH